MTNRLPEKGTEESIVLGFDFSRESAAVETASVEVTAETGTDGNPLSLLYGAAQIDAGKPALVLQRVAGGVDQVNYRLRCTVTTIEGDTLSCDVILPVRLKL